MMFRKTQTSSFVGPAVQFGSIRCFVSLTEACARVKTMSANFSKLFEFISLVGQLKRVHRTGWVLRNVSDSESVADHMYRMSVLSFLVDNRSGLNRERCIKLSLIHDMAECIVGDLTPTDEIDKEEKHKREKTAMSHICSLVNKDVGTELMNIWEEYEEQKTAESVFVKDLDKFDMIFQAYEYEQLENKPGSLQEFFDSTNGKFQTDTVQAWAKELKKIRSQPSNPALFSSPNLRTLNQSASRESCTVHPFSVNHEETKS